MLYNIRFDTYQFNLKCYFYTRKEKTSNETCAK